MRKPNAIPHARSTTPSTWARRTGTSPAAMGRKRFFLWSRSASTSKASFRKYVPLAARQNATNAMPVSAMA